MASLMFIVLASIISVTKFTSVASDDLFTALVDLERLIQTEKSIVRSLGEYLVAEEARLDKIRHIKETYEELHDAAASDPSEYLSNPINAYLIVKRLSHDWKYAENLMLQAPSEMGRAILDNMTRSSPEVTFPSSEDLDGAAAALLRLQDTYKLDTSTLASGVISPIHSPTSQIAELSPTKSEQTNILEPTLSQPIIAGYSNVISDSSLLPISKHSQLTSSDCFELGRHSYNNGDHHHTILWMEEAMSRLEREPASRHTVTKADILEYLAFSTYRMGDVKQALRLTDDLLGFIPNHERALGNKMYYIEELKKQSEKHKKGDDGEDLLSSEEPNEDTNEEKQTGKLTSALVDRQFYDGLCRGEERVPPNIKSKLTCYFLDTKTRHPYTRLMRFRTEDLYLRPHIVLYHDIMSDAEIEVIRTLAQPRLRRATVQNSQTGNLETASYRISKSAWLRDEEHEVIKRVNRRVSLITRLNMISSEELQVVNYGIGGHYEPHFDFARREEKNAFKGYNHGNRIATWLSYMSDVTSGGATVFTELGLTVWPQKGSAAFWWNLHRNGEGDMLTRHAACPVLVGSKWVANKWVHERYQEFTRPCGLNINS